MNPDRLIAICTLARIEADAAPEGPMRDKLMNAAKELACVMRMLEDVAAGACPGCGRMGTSSATAGCKHPKGCGKANVAPEFAALLGAKPAAAPAAPESFAAAKRRTARASK